MSAKKATIISPDGKEVKGFPYSKQFAEDYQNIRAGEITDVRASVRKNELEKIVADETTHLNNASTLHHANLLMTMLESIKDGQDPKEVYEAAKQGTVKKETVAEKKQEPAAETHVQTKPAAPIDFSRIDYTAPGRNEYDPGVIVKVPEYVERSRSGDDWTFSSDGNRVFIRDKPAPGTFVKITREMREGLYTADIISAEDVIEKFGVKPEPAAGQKPKKETPKEDYLYQPDLFKQALNMIGDYTLALQDNLETMKTTNVPDHELEQFIKDARPKYEKEKQKNDDQMRFYDESKKANKSMPEGYQLAVEFARKKEMEFETGLENLELRLKQIREKKAYDVKLPDTTPKPKQTAQKPAKPLEEEVVQENQYMITIGVGTRKVNLIFTDDNLPETVGDFEAYLEETPFADRKEAETVKLFQNSVLEGGSIVYGGKRYSSKDSFAGVFKNYKSRISVKEEKKVQRTARVAQVSAPQGGSNA
ncbi:hypothetical protein ACFL6I_13755 [candidate division KSB1 bacterium]